MGHMNTARYAAIFDAATWTFLRALGYQWRVDAQWGWADVKNTFEYLRELPVDSHYYVSSFVSRLGGASFTLIHELHRSDESYLAARCEAILVSFDRHARKSVKLTDEFRARAWKVLRMPGSESEAQGGQSLGQATLG
jgi:acyl-CoA thioester hydrolase